MAKSNSFPQSPAAAVSNAAAETLTQNSNSTTTTNNKSNNVVTAPQAKPMKPRQWRPSVHEIYTLPAPIRTFPLPVFHPSNPVSLLYIVTTWVAQVMSPPVEPSIIHDGIWYPESKSVHIVNHKSMRALWEQGFYGKGNLSRSEPHWVARQKAKKTGSTQKASENITAQRRAARQKAKWERARSQQEAIEQTRREEADRAASRSTLRDEGPQPSPPTGPLELLALPNSSLDLEEPLKLNGMMNGCARPPRESARPSEGSIPLPSSNCIQTHAQISSGSGLRGVLKIDTAPDTLDDSKSLKRQKSVRFSPTVESTTFNLSDPPNANILVPSAWSNAVRDTSRWLSGLIFPDPTPAKPRPLVAPSIVDDTETSDFDDLESKEHLQLTPEEAFFLAFSFGALRILDPSTKDAMPLERVFILFRQHSYFPPRSLESSCLRTDDPFLLHYVVYHHFRSMGWCVRSGIKFGVDWLLYLRGPVFNHAEFGILVISSYSHAWWKTPGNEALQQQKTWSWLSGIGRTLSQVFKTLVLVYVEVPPPPVFDSALERDGLAGALGRFQVREVMMGRWLHNRNRSVAPGQGKGGSQAKKG